MKIIYILHSTIMGGATISFITMIKGMIKLGITPIIVIPKECNDNEFNKFIKEYDIEIHKLTIVSSYLKRIKNWKDIIKIGIKIPILCIKKIYGYRQLIQLCKKIKPDIIHTNVGVIHESSYVAQKLNIPHIWHLREYQTLDFDMKIFPSYNYFCNILKKSNVITITEDIKSYFKLDKSSTAFTIYNGIFHRNDTYDVFDKEEYFLCASRISPEKGHKEIIKTFCEFSKFNNNYKLYIAGFGDKVYIEELKEIASLYNCLDKIYFTGFIKDIKPIMQKAKALIVGSYNEGFGRMTAEACFCGCLVIGRNTGGTKEILDQTGGFQFSNNEELLQHMKQISTLDNNNYKNIALKAQKKAIELYSIESNIEKIFKLYTAINNNEQ